MLVITTGHIGVYFFSKKSICRKTLQLSFILMSRLTLFIAQYVLKVQV